MKAPRIRNNAAALAATAGPRESPADRDKFADARVSSRAKMGPARGMPMKAVNAPAAPAYTKISFFLLVVSSLPPSLVCHFLPIDKPIRPPAHTIGASGPTLKPKVDVTSDKINRLGNAGSSAGSLETSLFFPESAATNSATVCDGFNIDDKIPISNPPRLMVQSMYRLLPPRLARVGLPLAARNDGSLFQTLDTVVSRICP